MNKNIIISIVVMENKNNGYSWIDIGYINELGFLRTSDKFIYEKSDPAIIRWMPLPEIPKEDN